MASSNGDVEAILAEDDSSSDEDYNKEVNLEDILREEEQEERASHEQEVENFEVQDASSDIAAVSRGSGHSADKLHEEEASGGGIDDEQRVSLQEGDSLLSEETEDGTGKRGEERHGGGADSLEEEELEPEKSEDARLEDLTDNYQRAYDQIDKELSEFMAEIEEDRFSPDEDRATDDGSSEDEEDADEEILQQILAEDENSSRMRGLSIGGGRAEYEKDIALLYGDDASEIFPPSEGRASGSKRRPTMDHRRASMLLSKAAHIVKMTHKETSPLEEAQARELSLWRIGKREMVSPLRVKRNLQSASTGKSRQLEGSSSEASMSQTGVGGGLVKVEPLSAISLQLQKNAEFPDYGPGLPTAAAVDAKFITIGTSRSLVLVFDHFENIRTVLGNTSNAPHDGPVTAIDLARGSALLLISGYGSGRVVLWDLMKGTSLKALAVAHQAPVASLKFVRHRKPVVLSVDTKGIVNRISYWTVMYRYNADVNCILDGAAGQIPTLAVLPAAPSGTATSFSSSGAASGSASSSIGGHPVEQYHLVALSSDKSTFVISMEPQVKVLFKWPRPVGLKAGSSHLPSLTFDWGIVSSAQRRPEPLLVRSWGNHIQIVQVFIPGGDAHVHTLHGWPQFSVVREFKTPVASLAPRWLSPQALAYLNAHDELCVYDTQSDRLLDTVDVSSVEMVYATYKGGNEKDKEERRSFANSFITSASSLYMLGLSDLRVAKVQSWEQRVDALTEAGEWLEALALALDQYETLKDLAIERAGQAVRRPVHVRNPSTGEAVSVDILRMEETNRRTGVTQDVCRVELGPRAQQRAASSGQQQNAAPMANSGVGVQWLVRDEPYAAEFQTKLESAFQAGRQGTEKPRLPMRVVEKVAELLMDYVRLAMANAPETDEEREQQRQKQEEREREAKESVRRMLSGEVTEDQSKKEDSEGGRGDKGAVTKSDTREKRKSSNGSRALDLATTHYEMLGGVCIEYCVVIGRTDLLFGEIFKKFRSVGRSHVLVELLEPYILQDKLKTLTPEVLQVFVEDYTARHRLARVEQCLLHLDVSMLDFNTVLRLCESRGLYSALIYVYNEGLKDYLTPLGILLKAASGDKSANSIVTASSSSASENERRRVLYGYKLLLYISHCMSGQKFPLGQEEIPVERRALVRSEILRYLFDKSASPHGGAESDGAAAATEGSKNASSYPRLRQLCALDVKEVLHLMRILFERRNVHFEDDDADGGSSVPQQGTLSSSSGALVNASAVATCPSRMKILLALAEVIVDSRGAARDGAGVANGDGDAARPFSDEDEGHFFMFEGYTFSSGAVDPLKYAQARARAAAGSVNESAEVSAKRELDRLMSFLALGTMDPASSGESTAKERETTDGRRSSGLKHRGSVTDDSAKHYGLSKVDREDMLVRLLQRLPHSSFDADKLLALLKKQKMNRAAAIILRERHSVAEVIRTYLDDSEEEYRLQVFPYIGSEMDYALSLSDRPAVKSGGILSHIDQFYAQGLPSTSSKGSLKAKGTGSPSSSPSVSENSTTGSEDAEAGGVTLKAIERVMLKHLVELLSLDSLELTLLVMTRRPQLHESIMKVLTAMGDQGDQWEFEYLHHITSAINFSQDRTVGPGRLGTRGRLPGEKTEGGEKSLEKSGLHDREGGHAARGGGGADEVSASSSPAFSTTGHVLSVLHRHGRALESKYERLQEALERSGLQLEQQGKFQERYVALLCRFAPETVFSYLEKHDNYPVEDCLALCKKYEVTDATAYLLQRTGDVRGALHLLLQVVEEKAHSLRQSLEARNKSSTILAALTSASAAPRLLLSTEMGEQLKESLDVAIALCQRNSLAHKDEEGDETGDSLWLELLDRLLMWQRKLKLLIRQRTSSSVVSGGGSPQALNGTDEKEDRDGDTSSSTRSFHPTSSEGRTALGKSQLQRSSSEVSAPDGGAVRPSIMMAGASNRTGAAEAAMHAVMLHLVRNILESMASYVSLERILRKITTDHRRNEFREFRPTLLGILETYRYEQNIYHTATSLLAADTHRAVLQLHRQVASTTACITDTCQHCQGPLLLPPLGLSATNSAALSGGNQASSVSNTRGAAASMVVVSGGGGVVAHELCSRLSTAEGREAVTTLKAAAREKEKKHAIDSGPQGAGASGAKGSAGGDGFDRRKALKKWKRMKAKIQQSPDMDEVLQELLRYSDSGTAQIPRALLNSEQSGIKLVPQGIPKATRIGLRNPGSLPAKAANVGSIGA